MKLFTKIKYLFKVSRNIIKLASRIEELEQELRDTQEMTLETIDLSIDKGWPITVQHAILALDEKINKMSQLVILHQEYIDELEEEAELYELATSSPEKELN